MIKSLFKLDLRSLALVRVLFGVLTFFDIARRIPDLEAFFTDGGILPRWILLEQFELNYRMGLLSLNGTYSFAFMLAVVGMLASITFALGWRTRLSNLIVWLVIISFQVRFPEGATSGGDMLIRIFLFWSLFLPMSARYSMDCAVAETKVSDNEFQSIFSATWIVQIFLLYFMTFLFKWGPVYHTTFDAVYYMMQLDIFTTPLGKWLSQYHGIMKGLTFAAYALEIIGPLLLIIPFKRDLFRGAAVVSFWLFHLGIGATMHLGNFVPICLIIWVGLIPTSWWNYLSVKVRSSSLAMKTLYYDGQSELARKLGLIAKEMLLLDSVRVLPASTNPKADALISGHNFVFEDENQQLLITSLIPKLLLSSRLFFIRILGRIFNSEISLYLNEVKEVGEVSMFSDKTVTTPGNDTSSSKFKDVIKVLFETIGFDKIKMHLNKFEKLVGAFLLTLVVAWNIEGYITEREWSIGSPFDEVMFTLHLNQGWAMFAPHPQRSDGWWVVDGTLKSGKKWDVLNNKEVQFDRPDDFYATYSSEDWRKFLDNLQATRDEAYLLLLGKHLCRSWNSQNGGENTLQTFKIYFMQEFTNGPTEPPAKVEKVQLWNHSCF